MSALASAAAPDLPVSPADWSYLAEGGFHIILRYDGNDPALQGRILRIGKKSLGHEKKEEEGGEEGDEGDEGKKKQQQEAKPVPDEAGARRKFERGVLMPLLGEQYVQPGDAVTLSREDIGKIHLRWVGGVLCVVCIKNSCSSCSSSSGGGTAAGAGRHNKSAVVDVVRCRGRKCVEPGV